MAWLTRSRLFLLDVLTLSTVVLALSACASGGSGPVECKTVFGTACDAGYTGAVDSGVDGDAGPIVQTDGGGVYDNDGSIVIPELCPATSIVPPGCVSPVNEDAASLCNGLDDDCDGEVDEGCVCKRGAVQRCFLGPPSRRHVGACQEGQQVCIAEGEFISPHWGPCEGGVTPAAEACDNLDNDCNGCTDEIVGCAAIGDCPGPNDPRVAEAKPFKSYLLKGGDFFPSALAKAWKWEIEGTPCDKLFQSVPGSPATAENGMLSFQLLNGTQKDATVNFTLSGDYRVTLTVTQNDDTIFRCTWIVHVRGPGIRVELCWDATGPTSSSSPVDLDLHLGKESLPTVWGDPQTDCFFGSCKVVADETGEIHANWNYPLTPERNCVGPGARGTFGIDNVNGCPNPRLDIDNVSAVNAYVPENVNLDNPRDGDQFRVLVYRFSSNNSVATHPLVNIYCGGELRATYGATPNQVTELDTKDEMWRVADILTHVDGAGVTTGCTITALPESGTGYWITPSTENSY